ncbi:GNAT family N-acetyltransferase [Humibacter ginsenosidimutans]|uniref:GNAT family N-acetyltransferase n=1 Tax=Humibacter ginsenosidimutans TaxID=2599293 RepID=A0A5B8M5U7_9MICO|nr:GNAT family N-acetyltransferase [Humibacter ginsenosidimutans]QDZ15997.1 GNAT family N-acetyltransferase [Humibacter ginsenosidimutans]
MARRIQLDGASIEVVPAYDHWDGFYDVVGVKKPDGRGCWCMSYRDTRAGIDPAAYMKNECENEPGPGVLAYVDGEPAGWCSIAPRSSYRRLMNSRTIPFVDDEEAWSIVCFVVKPAYRRQGLMLTLLDGAVRHARDHGASVVEGYPIDLSGQGRVDMISGYVGSTDLFERAGFERAALTSSHIGGRDRWVMRKRLA